MNKSNLIALCRFLPIRFFRIVFLALLFALVSCEQTREKYETRLFFAMGTIVEITVSKKNREKLPEAEKRLIDIANIIRADCLKISSSPDAVAIDEITYQLLQREDSYRKISKNRFNSAVYTISALYGFPEGPFAVPTSDKTEKAKELLFSQRIDLFEDAVGGGYFAKGNGLKVDLGGFAKGWVVDDTVSYLKSEGVDNFIVNAGGDLFAGGTKDRDQMWRVGITDPDKKEPFVTSVFLSDKGLATSGIYERFFIAEDGRRISHIFDGTNGEPVNNYKSLSVIADTAELADAYSTIYFLLSQGEIAYLCKQNGTSVFLVTADGVRLRYCGWEKYEISENR